MEIIKDGFLLVLEGVHGVGKSTLKKYMVNKLREKGYHVVETEWNSEPLFNSVIQEMKKRRSFTPRSWSLIHAAEFAHRYDTIINPALNQGGVVICDRYIYTALTRDTVRGIDEAFIRNCYSFIKEPDLVIYINAPVEVTLKRRKFDDLMYYSSGMDVTGLNMEESFVVYQAKLKEKYMEIFEGKKNVIELNGEMHMSNYSEYIDLVIDKFINAKIKLYNSKA